MNVLLVEDNEADRRIFQEAFAVCEDATLQIVEDGEKALQAIATEGEFIGTRRPDLILLDLNLPGMHGRDVLRKLKADAKTKHIPVVIFTSSTFQGDICECYELSANCYVNKPMRYTELVKLVQLICDFWAKQVRYCYQ